MGTHSCALADVTVAVTAHYIGVTVAVTIAVTIAVTVTITVTIAVTSAANTPVTLEVIALVTETGRALWPINSVAVVPAGDVVPGSDVGHLETTGQSKYDDRSKDVQKPCVIV